MAWWDGFFCVFKKKGRKRMTKKQLNVLFKQAVKLSNDLMKLVKKIDRGLKDRGTRLGK